MKGFYIKIQKYFYHAPYHDHSGYELEIVYDSEKPNPYTMANARVELTKFVEMLKKDMGSRVYSDSKNSDHYIVYTSYSIGD